MTTAPETPVSVRKVCTKGNKNTSKGILGWGEVAHLATGTRLPKAPLSYCIELACRSHAWGVSLRSRELASLPGSLEGLTNNPTSPTARDPGEREMRLFILN